MQQAFFLFEKPQTVTAKGDEQRGNRTIAKTELNGNADYTHKHTHIHTTKKEKREARTGFVPCARYQQKGRAFWSGKNKSFCFACCFGGHVLSHFTVYLLGRMVPFLVQFVINSGKRPVDPRPPFMVSHENWIWNSY